MSSLSWLLMQKSVAMTIAGTENRTNTAMSAAGATPPMRALPVSERENETATERETATGGAAMPVKFLTGLERLGDLAVAFAPQIEQPPF